MNKREVTKKVKEVLGSDYTVRLRDIAKNNTTKKAIEIRKGDEVLSPVFYFDSFSGTNDEVANAIVDMYFNELNSRVPDVNVAKFRSWEHVSEKLTVHLVQQKGNEELVSGTPHKKFLDLYIVPYVEVNANMIAKVTDSTMSYWDKTDEEVVMKAISNVLNKGHVAENMFDVLMDQNGIEEEEREFFRQMAQEMPAQIVCSNKERNFGANVLLNEELLDSLHEKYGNLVIIPSSVHEVIVMQADSGADRDEFVNMIQSVNTEQLTDTEVLSDHPYYYYGNGEWRY